MSSEQKLNYFGTICCLHSPYSPDVSLSDFLSCLLSSIFRGVSFQRNGLNVNLVTWHSPPQSEMNGIPITVNRYRSWLIFVTEKYHTFRFDMDGQKTLLKLRLNRW